MILSFTEIWGLDNLTRESICSLISSSTEKYFNRNSPCWQSVLVRSDDMEYKQHNAKPQEAL